LYPLRQENLSEPVDWFCELLQKDEIEVRSGPMSSLITAESDVIFRSLKEAFEKLAKEYQIVLIAKISNACPDSKKE
jgi:uncharacterized protein YqgV (UPF0045/DUF77 family)